MKCIIFYAVNMMVLLSSAAIVFFNCACPAHVNCACMQCCLYFKYMYDSQTWANGQGDFVRRK